MSADPRRLSEGLARIRERLAYLRSIQPETFKRPERLFKCRHCLDEGLVIVDETQNAYRPCTCRPEQYQHWTHGGYRPLSEGGSILSLNGKKDERERREDQDRERFGGRR